MVESSPLDSSSNDGNAKASPSITIRNDPAGSAPVSNPARGVKLRTTALRKTDDADNDQHMSEFVHFGGLILLSGVVSCHCKVGFIFFSFFISKSGVSRYYWRLTSLSM
jgi:hypothetical protein